MTGRRVRVLLVMHNIPLESTFLANKFLKLSESVDVHLLVWDNKERIEKFISDNGLNASTVQRIHRAINGNNILSVVLNLIYIVFAHTQARNYILKGSGNLLERLKNVIYYLPVLKTQPDIIHFEFGTLAKNLSALKQMASGKVVVSFRGYDINYVALHQSGYYDEVWNHADGLHFLGQDLKQRAIKRGYKADKPEAIIPPAIDTSLFTPSGIKKAGDKLVIISVGRLVWKKGYEYGVRAAALLKRKQIPFEYHIIGDGQHLQALQFTISEMGLQQEVILHGNITQAEVKDRLERAHVFLHPAISEGFCNAVIEAQAMALPVICTDADGLRENIQDGKTGFIVPKWDVEAMADKLEWFWKNPEQLWVFGKEGVERVNSNFRIERQTETFLQFYGSLHEPRK